MGIKILRWIGNNSDELNLLDRMNIVFKMLRYMDESNFTNHLITEFVELYKSHFRYLISTDKFLTTFTDFK